MFSGSRTWNSEQWEENDGNLAQGKSVPSSFSQPRESTNPWSFYIPPTTTLFNCPRPPPSFPIHIDSRGNRYQLPQPASVSVPKRACDSSTDQQTVQPEKPNSSVLNKFPNIPNSLIDLAKSNFSQNITIAEQKPVPKRIEDKNPRDLSTCNNNQGESLSKSSTNKAPKDSSTCQRSQILPEKSMLPQISTYLTKPITAGTSKQQTSTEKNPHGSNTNAVKMAADPRPKKLQEVSVFRLSPEPRIIQPTSSPEEPTSNVLIPEAAANALVHNNSSVQAVLSCSDCKEWLPCNQVVVCDCRIICQACMNKPACDYCSTTYLVDSRVANLHQRIAKTISHPCRYRPHCNHMVKPGDLHEETCPHAPVPCFVCKKPVSNLKAHCELHHAKEVLTGTNNKVKVSNFVKLEASGQLVIYGFIHGIVIPIQLIKIDSNDNKPGFVVSNPEFNKETACTITVKFEFQVNSYSHTQERKLANDNQLAPDPVEIPQDVFYDWFNGKNKLCISIRIRKRKILAIKKNPNKKGKPAAIGEVDGNASNFECFDDDSF